MKDKLIVEKGNSVFNIMMIAFVMITAFLCRIFMKFPVDKVRLYLIYLNLVQIIITIPYRIYLVFDKEYMDSVYPNVKKAYLFELPFFPCNTAELLFIFAVMTHSRMMLSYCFFLGLAGPVIAFFFQPPGFVRESLLKPRMLGFYLTHFICLMNIPIMLCTGYYRPGYMDVFMCIGLFLILAGFMYFFNLYLDSLNLGMKGNYFFVNDPDYHPNFRKVYDKFPVRYVFILPYVGIVCAGLLVFVSILKIFY